MTPHSSPPLIAAVDMGYGHLRAAYALAETLRGEVLKADSAPLVSPAERKSWESARGVYEFVSRTSQLPWIGRPFRSILSGLTHIPELHPYRDLSHATWPVRRLDRMIEKGLGEGIVKRTKETGLPLLTTFYVPAIAASKAGCPEVYCVVTDSDIHRIWVPASPQTASTRYFVPSPRAMRRLLSYGVPKQQIEFTGFPLPDSLIGGAAMPVLRRNLLRRLTRLDPEGIFRKIYSQELLQFLGELPEQTEDSAPLLTFAVGGAGAQTRIVRQFLPGFREDVKAGRIRIALSAGMRREVAEDLLASIEDAGLGPCLGREVRVLHEPDFPSYYARFNELLGESDILWTKPSEMTFYAALGIPLIFSWPVGHHEKCNRRWAIESGAGLKQSNPRFASQWIGEWLSDGTLAAAAWSGFTRLPKFGTHRIWEAIRSTKSNSTPAEARPQSYR